MAHGRLTSMSAARRARGALLVLPDHEPDHGARL
jgi:hypothetical protein